MKERDGIPMWVMHILAAATFIGVFLLSAAGAFPQETPLDVPTPIHKPTAGVVAPIERIALGTHYQPEDVGNTVALEDGERVLQWMAEQHYCVPLTPLIAEYLNRRADALDLVGIARGETVTGAYLAFMVRDGKYGEVWLAHDPTVDIPIGVACLVGVMVYAPDT